MTRRCNLHRELEHWSRQESDAPLPSGLAEHASTCTSCGNELRAITEVRSLAQRLPVVPISEERVNAMRFALMAAAREAARPAVGRAGAAQRAQRVQPSSWARWAALAAAVLSVALYLWFGFERSAAPVHSFAQVRLAPSARGHVFTTGPDESFALEDGVATFSVQKLHAGQRFRVLVGRDVVSVRGTVFHVDAAQGRLKRVSVSEGVVVVSVDGTEVATLERGQSWTRPVSRDVRLAPSAVPTPRQPALPSEPALPSDPARVIPDADPVRSPNPPLGSSSAEAEPTVQRTPGDAQFQRAWSLLQTGNPRAAAQAFDALTTQPATDPGRRADGLFWAARAYFQAGAPTLAKARAERVMATSPHSWHAPHAALLLAEIAIASGDRKGASAWLERARESGNRRVVERADALGSHLKE